MERFLTKWAIGASSLWRLRRRVLVCDSDAAICGAMAHLVGVALKTPMVAASLSAHVRVEVLGEYQLSSPLMATAMGEMFAAEPVTNLSDASDVASVITMSGLSQVPAERAFVKEANAPIVCLSRLHGVVRSHEAPPALATVACAPDEAFNEHVLPNFSIVEMADMCFAFAAIVANELQG